MAKVALYHPWIYLKGGAERFIYELVARSRHDWVIFTNYYDSENTFPGFARLKVEELSSVSVKRTFGKAGLAALKVLCRKIPLDGFDSLLVSSEGVGDLVTFRNSHVPVLAYCHTPLKVIHDHQARAKWLSEHHFLKWIPFIVLLSLFNLVDKLAWRKYKLVLCNSKEVKRRIVKGHLTKLTPEVVPCGVEERFFSINGSRNEKYFLIVGRIMWTKSIEVGIAAFLKPELYKQGYKMRIVGMVDEKSKPYFEKLQKQAGEQDYIRFYTNPDEDELLNHYENAYCVVFTPQNEDFGIVVLEGMAAGKVVIATNRGGPAEIIRNGDTGILCDGTSDAFSSSMRWLTENEDERKLIAEKAREAAKQYDWEHTVAKIDDGIDKLTGLSSEKIYVSTKNAQSY